MLAGPLPSKRPLTKRLTPRNIFCGFCICGDSDDTFPQPLTSNHSQTPTQHQSSSSDWTYYLSHGHSNITRVRFSTNNIPVYGWQLGMHFTLSTSSRDPQSFTPQWVQTIQVVRALNDSVLAEQTAKTAYESWSLTSIFNSQERMRMSSHFKLFGNLFLLMLTFSFSLRVIHFPDDC